MKKVLIRAVLFVFALLNASFVGVVAAEMVSVPVGLGAALATLLAEAVGIHYVRKAMAAGAASAGATQPEGQA
jgi:hypothetical protein